MPLHAYETTTPSRQYQSSPILVIGLVVIGLLVYL